MASGILSGDRWISLKKDLGIIFGLFLLIVVLLVFGQGFTTANFFRGETGAGQIFQKSNGLTVVVVRTLRINTKVATSAGDRKKGLSKRESLPLDEGLLFVFENKGLYGIWMKDMKFAIDVIWIGEDKKIVDIASNAPPEPGKKDGELKIYRPRSEAKYVLEINAGLAILHGLQIGDQANFEL